MENELTSNDLQMPRPESELSQWRVSGPHTLLRVSTAVNLGMCALALNASDPILWTFVTLISLAVTVAVWFPSRAKAQKTLTTGEWRKVLPKAAVSDDGRLLFSIGNDIFAAADTLRAVRIPASSTIDFEWIFVWNCDDALLLRKARKGLAGAMELKRIREPAWCAPGQSALVSSKLLDIYKSISSAYNILLLQSLAPPILVTIAAVSFALQENFDTARATLLIAPAWTTYYLPFVVSYMRNLRHLREIFLVNTMLGFVVILVCQRLSFGTATCCISVVLAWSALLAAALVSPLSRWRKKQNAVGEAPARENNFVEWDPFGSDWGAKMASRSEEEAPRVHCRILKIDDLLENRYRIVEPLGSGGMGEVYKAKDENLNRLVAIKVLVPEVLTKAEDRKRFKLEAKMLSELSHDNIVKLYRYGIAENLMPYLVMEHASGIGLNRIISREMRLPVERALLLSLQMCDGLQAAHHKGIVHRDLKPGNILVVSPADHEELVKIIDFGLALAPAGLQSQELTASGLLIGTATYMSPEQCRGEQVDQTSDLYSLGCVIYEMLAGAPPFNCESPIGLMAQHVSAEAIPVRSLRPDVPAKLDKILVKALSKKREDRYQSAGELRNDLQEVLADIAP